MTQTLTISGAVLAKAGAGVSTDLVSGSKFGLLADVILTKYINQAEGVIAALTRRDWVKDFSGLDADVKAVLDDACSSLAAMYAINYDMSGYTDRLETETMLNLLRDAFLRNASILKDKKTETFIDDA